MNAVIDWLVEGHDLTLKQYIVVIIFAFIGSAVCAFATNPTFKLPKYHDGEIDLGALKVLLIGTLCGVAVGHDPPIPFTVGLLTPVVLPVVLKKLVPVIIDQALPYALNYLKVPTRKIEEKDETLERRIRDSSGAIDPVSSSENKL